MQLFSRSKSIPEVTSKLLHPFFKSCSQPSNLSLRIGVTYGDMKEFQTQVETVRSKLSDEIRDFGFTVIGVPWPKLLVVLLGECKLVLNVVLA